MRFLILNWKCWDDPEAGGSELNSYFIAKYLIKKGHKVTYFCRKSKKSNNLVPLKYRKNNIKIIRKGNRFSVYFWAFIFYIFSLRKKIDFIIDVHNAIPWFSTLYSRKRKLLIIHHIVDKIWFKEMRFPISLIGWFLEKKIMPKLYKKVPVIAVSPSTKNEVKKMGFKRVVIGYNGISDELKVGKKSSSPLIAYIGRVKKYKNIDILIKLSKDLNVNAVIVGQGDALNELKKKVKKEGLEKKVLFTGFVNDTEKIKNFQRAWVFVMPSKKEGWGITSIEANRCGTPVVAFDVEGLKDAIKNNETGFLVKDYEEMKIKVKELIENKKLRESFGKKAIAWSKKFTWDDYCRTVLKEIEKIAK